MKILYTQKKDGKQDNPELLAGELARKYKVKDDKVPPAYPCENEVLVILCFENYGKIDPKLIKFCQDLSTARAHNVALIVLSKDGSTKADELTDIFKQNGVNVAGSCGLAIPKGLFGAKKYTDADAQKAMSFCDQMIGKLFDPSALS